VQATLARQHPSDAEVSALAARRQQAEARRTLIKEASTARVAALVETVNHRLPPGVTIDQETLDATTVHLSGKSSGPAPLDRLARLQQRLGQPPFHAAALQQSTATTGGAFSFQMEVRF
jgi:hypothetical protein